LEEKTPVAMGLKRKGGDWKGKKKRAPLKGGREKRHRVTLKITSVRRGGRGDFISVLERRRGREGETGNSYSSLDNKKAQDIIQRQGEEKNQKRSRKRTPRSPQEGRRRPQKKEGRGLREGKGKTLLLQKKRGTQRCLSLSFSGRGGGGGGRKEKG